MDRTSPEYLTMVAEGAKELCLERVLPVVDALMGPDGETFGDVPLEGAEFVAWFMDKQQRGVFAHLEVLNPELTEQLRREFDRQFRRMNEMVFT